LINGCKRFVSSKCNYRLALDNQDPERILYLAVPKEIFDGFFQIPFIQNAVEEYNINIIVYDPTKEVIVKWQT